MKKEFLAIFADKCMVFAALLAPLTGDGSALAITHSDGRRLLWHMPFTVESTSALTGQRQRRAFLPHGLR